jgi:hypothetical protein
VQGVELDSLEIKIQATATKANNAIDNMITRLEKLSGTLNGINGTSLSGLANGVNRLAAAMQTMKNVGTADFTRLAKNITKLGSINTVSLNNTASSLSHITRAFSNLASVPQNAASIGTLAQGISRLGSRSVQNAAVNIPRLTASLITMLQQLSRAPAVSNGVIRLADSLANLASQGSKVNTASASLQGSLNNTDKAAKRTHKGVRSLASIFGKLYANFFWVIRGMKSLWKSIEGTADYIEAFNYKAVAFGKIGSEWGKEYEKYGYSNAEAYANSFSKRVDELLGKLSGLSVDVKGGLIKADSAKNLGLNIQEITQYASQLASVTNSLGQTGEATTAITKSMTMLAGDISSLFNVDYSTVATNLQSGLIGQSRALYKYGIDITNATLATYAYNLGITKSVSEMSQAEKQQLRFIAILDQSKVSWGDLANTINSPNNMLRQFKTNLSETGMVLGQIFVPVLQKVMPVVNGVTIAFKRLLVSIAQFAGVKIDFESFGQSGYKDTTDGLEDISDGYDGVAESAKKAAISLMGFDEVNKLSENSDNSGKNTGTGDIDLTDKIVEAASEYEKVWQKAFDNMNNKANEWADKFESKLYFLKNIGKLIANGEYYKAGETIAKKLSNGIHSFGWDKTGTFIGKSITNTLDLVAGFTNNFNWKRLASDLTSLINNAIKNIKPKSFASAINGILNGIWDFVTTFFKTLNWKQFASFIGQLLQQINWGTVAKIGLAVGMGKLAKTAATSFFSGFKAQMSVGNLMSGIGSVATYAGTKVGSAFISGLTSPLMAIPAITATILIGENDYYSRLAELYEKARGEVDETTQKFVDDINTSNDKIKELADGIYDSFQKNDTTTQADKLKIIADKYFELADGADKSTEALKKLDEYKKILIEEGGEQFKTILEDENSSLDDQKEKIYDVIDALKAKGLQEAASKGITETTNLIMEQRNTYDESKGEMQKAKQKMLNLQAERPIGQDRMRTYLAMHYVNGEFQPVLSEDGKKVIQDTAEVANKFWDMFDRYADEAFNETLPDGLRKSKKEIAEIVASSENVAKQWNDAAANYGALLEQYNKSADILAELETQLDYYTSISSGAIDAQTSLYAYQGQKASETQDRYKELRGDVQDVNEVMAEADITRQAVTSKMEESFNPSKWTGIGTTSISNYIGGIGDPAKTQYGIQVAQQVAHKIAGPFNTKSDFASYGKYSIQGYLEGLKAEWGNRVKKGLETVTDGIKNIFKKGFKISSPSKLFKQYGKWTLEGYDIGFENQARETYQMVTGWSDRIASVPESLGEYNADYSASYSNEVTAEYSSSEQVALMQEQNRLLRELLDKETVIVPNENGIFNTVRKQANEYVRQTGDLPWTV